MAEAAWLVLLIALLLGILVVCAYSAQSSRSVVVDRPLKVRTKFLFETHPDPSQVPAKVSLNRRAYANSLTRIVLDDAQCEELVRTDAPSVLTWWKGIKSGAHRADLVRALLLYRHGGAYLDIKTELLANIESLLPEDNDFCGVLSLGSSSPLQSMYNGVLSCREGLPLMATIIEALCRHSHSVLENRYSIFCEKYHDACASFLGEPPVPGLCVSSAGIRLRFQVETVTDTVLPIVCPEGLDRYGLCCGIRCGESWGLLARTRYADYPWTK